LAVIYAYFQALKVANIRELKNNSSKFIGFVEQGEVVQICRHNVPVAKLIPNGAEKTGNRTQLGCGEGTAEIKGDLTEPLIPEER